MDCPIDYDAGPVSKFPEVHALQISRCLPSHVRESPLPRDKLAGLRTWTGSARRHSFPDRGISSWSLAGASSQDTRRTGCHFQAGDRDNTHVGSVSPQPLRPPGTPHGGSERESHAAEITSLGGIAWRKRHDYGLRSLGVGVGMTVIGWLRSLGDDDLRARSFRPQQKEAAIDVAVANRMIRTAKSSTFRGS